MRGGGGESSLGGGVRGRADWWCGRDQGTGARNGLAIGRGMGLGEALGPVGAKVWGAARDYSYWSDWSRLARSSASRRDHCSSSSIQSRIKRLVTAG